MPRDLASFTGGYSYDRRIIAGLSAAGWVVEVVALDAGFPWTDPTARDHAAQQIAALPDGSLVVVDGLAFGVMPDVAERHAARLRWVALVHHPLALETGLTPQQGRAVFDSERRALASARGVIATSAATARELTRYGVTAAGVYVVTPGTDPAPLATGSGADSANRGLSLLCVAALIPRKGHAVLIEALRGLKDRPWTLHCVGSATRDADTANALCSAIAAHGLGERVRLHGEVTPWSLQAMYGLADAVVLPSSSRATVALAEALARGLPVVSTMAAPSILCPAMPAFWCRQETRWRSAPRCGLARRTLQLARRPRGASGPRCLAHLASGCLALCRGAGRPRHRHAPGAAMTGFSADWLRLREPFDRGSSNSCRGNALLERIGQAGAIAGQGNRRGGSGLRSRREHACPGAAAWWCAALAPG